MNGDSESTIDQLAKTLKVQELLLAEYKKSLEILHKRQEMLRTQVDILKKMLLGRVPGKGGY
jgi:hypothetical protein